jgi:tripartite ATP-independent transporter DctM subunit
LSTLAITSLLIGALFVLLALGVWVAVSLLVVGLIALLAFTDLPVDQVLATAIWSTIASWPLSSLPLFIWMGEILFRTRLADDMFKGLVPWTASIPGRLLHVNVLGSGIFAAVSGSSAATAATIGKITLPELFRRRYPEKIAMGSLAAGGTLGILIPPSIPMIVYGVAAQVSIAKLFIAGIVPGAILMTLFCVYTGTWALFHKPQMPEPERRYTLAGRLRATGRLLPVVLLIAAVTGSLYTGIATPTEAAAVGVLGALVIAAATRSLTFESFAASLKGTLLTSCMIVLILAEASFL